MCRIVLAFVSLFFLIVSPAGAAAQNSDKWVVTQLSGDARVVHPGLQSASLKVNGQITPGDMLVTGANGRAMLIRGADYIVIAPRSELRLPSTPQPTGFTRVIQTLGTMLFKVQHTGIPHFAVDTPMLAAVVKGTTFTVVVDHNRSAVQVIQGVVQVSAADGGMSRLVEGGRTVFVDHDRPKMLLDADKGTPATSAPSSSRVEVSATAETPLASIAELTGGLVRSEPPAPRNPVSVAVAAPVTPGAAPSPLSEAVPAAGPSTPAVSTPAVGTPAATTPNAPVPAATPAVTAPAVITPVVATPAVPTPTITTVAVTVPPVGTPAVTVPSVTTPTLTVPAVTTPSVTIPSLDATVVSTPAVTVPAVTILPITVPAVPIPAVTVPAVTTPAINVPAVTVPAITVPPVTVSTSTVPAVTIPAATTPAVSVPVVTVPTITVPPVTLPNATVPAVTVPVVTVPAVTAPSLLPGI